MMGDRRRFGYGRSIDKGVDASAINRIFVGCGAVVSSVFVSISLGFSSPIS